MGSYNRITIALFLLICLISVGRGNDKCRQRGDLRECRTTTPTPTASSPTTSTPTTSKPTTSTPSPSTPTPLTPTPLTLTPLTSTPLTPSPSTPTTSTPTPLTPTPSTPTPLTPTPLTPTPLTSTPLTPTTSTPTPSTPTPSTPTPSTSTLSTLPGETEAVTEIGTTIIREESSRTTPTQQTLIRSTSAPESTNGISQNAVWTTVSREAKSAALGVTIVHSGVTEDTGNGTGVDVSTGGEGFTTHEVDTTSTPTTSTPTQSTPTTSTPTLSTSTPSTPTQSTSTLSTPLGETEAVTEIGTTIILEESSRTAPTQQTLTRSTSAPDSTNGITQNAVWTTVSREAKPTALGVTTVHSGVTEDTGNGTGVDVSTGGEGFTTHEVDVDVTSDGVDTTNGPLSGDLLSEGTTVEDPMNRLTVITTETLTTSDHGTTATLTTSEGQTTSSLLHVPETAERATTAPLQTSPLATSERATTSLLHTSLPPTTPERTTTAPLQTSSAKNYPRGDAFLYRTTTSTPTASTPTTSTLTTSEGETTSVLRTSLPTTTPERTTTAPLQTSIAKNCRGDLFMCRITTSTPTASTPTASTPTTSTLTTSEGETTSVVHTSPPPAERTTTAQQPTTSSQASTASPSTTHVAQTAAHDESQESRGDGSQESLEDESMNQISWTDLAEEDRENILTLSFNDITVVDWMMNYDLKFRQFLSKILTTNTLRVVPGNIYYIEPTPFQRGDILYVSVLPRYSSMKRSAQRSVPLNVTKGVFNATALADFLGIPEPTIFEGVPAFLLPTTLPTTDLPITQSLEQTEPPIIQPSTTEPPITQPSTTRRSSREIGFLSNPGLFISLVVIATVSIIIIIVGLIYLLCDRRRGRTGEYITNHTPRNSDLELGLDNPVMAENDKNVSNGNHLSSIKGDMESDMIVPYDNFTQEELMNYEVEDTHL